MADNSIFLEDFIYEVVDNEDRLSRFNVYFKRWISRFKTLKELTERIHVYDNVEIMIKDKYKFLDELYRLSEIKFLKVYNRRIDITISILYLGPYLLIFN